MTSTQHETVSAADEASTSARAERKIIYPKSAQVDSPTCKYCGAVLETGNEERCPNCGGWLNPPREGYIQFSPFQSEVIYAILPLVIGAALVAVVERFNDFLAWLIVLVLIVIMVNRLTYSPDDAD
jgi:hypothetical protein